MLPEEEERRWVADTLAKPGSQYWIVGHGGWQLHLRRSGGNPAKRPKISRRLRRILTPWSSMPPSKGRSHRSGPAPLASRDPAESLGTAIGLALPDKGLDPSESQARPTSLRKRSPAFTTGREVASPALSSMMRARPDVLSGSGAKVPRRNRRFAVVLLRGARTLAEGRRPLERNRGEGERLEGRCPRITVRGV